MAGVTTELRGAIALLVSAGTMPRDTPGLDALAATMAKLRPTSGTQARSIHSGWPLAIDAALGVRAVTQVPWL
ncbi:MAG: hypothetical protein M3Y87_09525, partial [Myxococcota bacterium]|nr:hypothetical protein [Myxococcota bacterium]